MRALITGSSGFIGFYLSKKLLELGYKVHGLDNHNDYYDVRLKKNRNAKLLHKNFSFDELDINDIDKLTIKKFDLAINLAAQAGVRVDKKREWLYHHSNVLGFKKFLNFCKENEIANIIYASSSSVYAENNNAKFVESLSPLKPKSKYGQSKLDNEIYASKFSNDNFSMVGLRFFSVYGPWGRPDMAYYLFTSSICKGKKIYLNNSGDMYRDMTYIDDIINGIVKTIDYISSNSSVCKNEVFNLGNDKPILTLKLLSTIEDELGKKAKFESKETNTETKFTHADISKARKILGYDPKVDFKEGINKFLNWYKEYE